MFWATRTDGDTLRMNRIPMRVFRYACSGDLLVIRAVSFQDSGSRTIVRQDVFPVPPVYRDLQPNEATHPLVPTLNARWLCNYFVVAFPYGRVGILTLVLYRGARADRWVTFRDVPGGVEVGVQAEFLDRVARELGEELRRLQGHT